MTDVLVNRYAVVSAYLNNQVEPEWEKLKREIARLDSESAGVRPKPIDSCHAGHTAFQPTDAEWKCPGCKAGIDEFYIEENAGHEDCPALHIEDYVVCHKCQATYEGGRLSKLLAKNNNLKPCQHCKGTGVVPA